MKTKDKIKSLCRDKYGISLTIYEQRLGYSNGSLSKDGQLRADRLLVVAHDLGVSMESLMDDELLEPLNTKVEKNQVFSSDEVSIIDAYRKADSLTRAMVLRTLGLDIVEKKAIG